MNTQGKRLLQALALGLALAGNVWTATHDEAQTVAGSNPGHPFGREWF